MKIVHHLSASLRQGWRPRDDAQFSYFWGLGFTMKYIPGIYERLCWKIQTFYLRVLKSGQKTEHNDIQYACLLTIISVLAKNIKKYFGHLSTGAHYGLKKYSWAMMFFCQQSLDFLFVISIENSILHMIVLGHVGRNAI